MDENTAVPDAKSADSSPLDILLREYDRVGWRPRGPREEVLSTITNLTWNDWIALAWWLGVWFWWLPAWLLVWLLFRDD